jgi:hypothetical protein
MKIVVRIRKAMADKKTAGIIEEPVWKLVPEQKVIVKFSGRSIHAQ